MPDKKCHEGVFPCDGKNCYLVSLINNQADTNLTNEFGTSKGRMTEQSFQDFLNRTAKLIPMCCQPALVEEVLKQVQARADNFFSGQK